MRVVIGVGLIVVVAICLIDATVLVGALLAIVRGDHRNPVTAWFVRWYAHRADDAGRGG